MSQISAREPGLSGIAVSDQVQVVITDESGRFVMDAHGYGLVFMSQPDGYVVNGSYWRVADGAPIEFGLTSMPSVSSFTFVHASDTHLSDDLWYYGHVDDLQLGWITADVGALPPDMPLVTFSHIPFIGGGESRGGFKEAGAAPSVIEIDGRATFRHSVYNHRDVLGPIQDRLEVALQGHIHMREVLKYQTQIGELRLITAAAVVGPPSGSRGAYGPVSGITLHRVTDGHVDAGTFLPLDPVPGGR